MEELGGGTASPLAEHTAGLMEKTGVQVEEESDERKTDLEEENCYKTISFHPTEARAHALSSQAQKRRGEHSRRQSTVHTTRKNSSMPENIWATALIRAMAGEFFFKFLFVISNHNS